MFGGEREREGIIILKRISPNSILVACKYICSQWKIIILLNLWTYSFQLACQYKFILKLRFMAKHFKSNKLNSAVIASNREQNPNTTKKKYDIQLLLYLQQTIILNVLKLFHQ